MSFNKLVTILSRLPLLNCFKSVTFSFKNSPFKNTSTILLLSEISDSRWSLPMLCAITDLVPDGDEIFEWIYLCSCKSGQREEVKVADLNSVYGWFIRVFLLLNGQLGENLFCIAKKNYNCIRGLIPSHWFLILNSFHLICEQKKGSILNLTSPVTKSNFTGWADDKFLTRQVIV